MPDTNTAPQIWLEETLIRFQGLAGTVHYQRDADLHLVAAGNIPPKILGIVRHVAHGKGMAGHAQTTRAPVQTCNLQTDTSGNINPAAREVGGHAAIALPVFDADDAVRAVVGLTFSYDGEVPPDDQAQLIAHAARLP